MNPNPNRPVTKPLSDSERVARLRLSLSANVGPITFRDLLIRYKSASAALEALPDLARRGGAKRAIRICTESDAEREMAKAKAYGGDCLILGDPDFPNSLAETDGAPPVLFYRGHLHLLKKQAVAIVGARNASSAGRKMAAKLATDLANAEQIIVSGMARGIDSAAHRASLANGTVAVVGGGIDIVYPRENEDLHREIEVQGLVLSETVLGTRPQARHFPRRNRIISGLSLAVVVVEAAKRSGSLITARLAGEQGRLVFAVPGSPLDPRSEGANHLIRSGATLVRNADDILTELATMTRRPLAEPTPTLFDTIENPQMDDRSLASARIIVEEMLSPTPMPLDDIIRQSELTAATVLTIVLELELAGVAERHPGNKISRL